MSIARLTTPVLKVRRLGYFIILSKLLKELGSLPELSLIREFEEKSLEKKPFLESYNLKTKKESPVTTTKKHNAAKRYIKTAREAELIAKFANEWYNTKLGQVLSFLPSKENPFDLSLFQRCFMLKILLKKDRHALIPLVKMLGVANISERLQFFKDYLSKKGSEVKMEKIPIKHFDENIEKPRLEWLKDLRVLDKNYRLDDNFLTFFSDDMFKDEAGFEDVYYKKFAEANKILDTVNFENLSNERKRELLRKYVDECHNLFSLHGGQIPGQQFLEYTVCLMLCRDKVLSSFSSIEKSFIDLFDYDLFPFKLRKIAGENIWFITRVGHA